MSKKNSTQSKKSEDERKAIDSVGLALVAVAVAAAPLFFFENPIALYDAGISKGFYGIAIWPSSVLAGYAFYHAVGLGRIDQALVDDPSKRTLAVITTMVIATMVMAQWFRGDYVGMENFRPWDALKIALPMFVALRALDAVFFQGVWQKHVLKNASRAVRLITTPLLAVVVHLGFIFAIVEESFVFRPEEITGYVGGTGFGVFVAALCFELGVPVWACALIHGAFGFAFVWFQQGILL